MLALSFAWAAACWWIFSCFILVFTAAACLLQPTVKSRSAMRRDRPPITVVIPVKLMEPDFEAALCSVVSQDTGCLEILVAVSDEAGDVSSLTKQILDRFHDVPSRIIRAQPGIAHSPKMDALILPLAIAKHDLILVKDAGIVLKPNQLTFLTRHLTKGVGLVTAATIVRDYEGIGASIEAAFLNGYHPRITLAASLLGLDGALGKVLLFSRSALERAGGVGAVSHTIAEDTALQRAFGRIGLRTVVAGDVVQQVIRRRQFTDVWLRQLRWSIIRRIEIPTLFLVEPFVGCACTAAAAFGGAPLVGIDRWAAAVSTTGFWICIEIIIVIAKGWSCTIATVPAAIVREIMIPLLWLSAWMTSRVYWAGQVLEVRRRPSPCPQADDCPQALQSNLTIKD